MAASIGAQDSMNNGMMQLSDFEVAVAWNKHNPISVAAVLAPLCLGLVSSRGLTLSSKEADPV